jgi:hypothetical protein
MMNYLPAVFFVLTAGSFLFSLLWWLGMGW